MSKKILPISYPMITSWQWHATLFSIIGDCHCVEKFLRN